MKSTPTRGVKQTLKPDAYKQSEPDSGPSGRGRVTAYLLYNGSASFVSSGKLKPLGVGAAKASLNRAPSFSAAGPKPGDLAMTRLKAG